MRKRIAYLLISCLMIGCLTGCGDNKRASSDSPEDVWKESGKIQDEVKTKVYNAINEYVTDDKDSPSTRELSKYSEAELLAGIKKQVDEKTEDLDITGIMANPDLYMEDITKYIQLYNVIWEDSKVMEYANQYLSKAQDRIKEMKQCSDKYGLNAMSRELIEDDFNILYRLESDSDGGIIDQIKKAINDYESEGYNWVATRVGQEDETYIIHTNESFSQEGQYYLNCIDSGENIKLINSKGFESTATIYETIDVDGDFTVARKKYQADAELIVTILNNMKEYFNQDTYKVDIPEYVSFDVTEEETVTEENEEQENIDTEYNEEETEIQEEDEYLDYSGAYDGDNFYAEISMYTSRDDEAYGNIILYDQNGEIIANDQLYCDEYGAPWDTKSNFVCTFSGLDESIFYVGFIQDDQGVYMDLGSLRQYYETLQMTEHYRS